MLSIPSGHQDQERRSKLNQLSGPPTPVSSATRGRCETPATEPGNLPSEGPEALDPKACAQDRGDRWGELEDRSRSASVTHAYECIRFARLIISLGLYGISGANRGKVLRDLASWICSPSSSM